MLRIKFISNFYEIPLIGMPDNTLDDNHKFRYLEQCWPTCISPHELIRLQWVNDNMRERFISIKLHLQCPL